jgi:hypothetical protein
MKIGLGSLWKLNELKNWLVVLSTNVFLSNADYLKVLNLTGTKKNTYIYIYIYIYTHVYATLKCRMQ